MGRDVRFGSLADIAACQRDVRFTPKSGHSRQLETTQKQSVQLIARFGSSADISHCNRLVRFNPASARSRLLGHCSRQPLSQCQHSSSWWNYRFPGVFPSINGATSQ